MQNKQSFKQVYLMISIFISLLILGFGVFLLVSKGFRENLIESSPLGIAFGVVCVGYGLFRGLFSVNKFKNRESE